MIKKWAKVISWQQGIALLRCEPHSGCGSCYSGCGNHTLNKLTLGSEHQLEMAIDHPLKPGQWVEIGITEDSLLRSTLLVYLTPLIGLISSGALLQYLFTTDFFTAIGAVAGGIGGFLLARTLATRLDKYGDYQPVILQIGLPPAALQLKQ